MKTTILKSLIAGIFFIIGCSFCILGIYAFNNWGNIPTVTSETSLTSNLWNDTMNTIKLNVQDLDNRLSSVIPSGSIGAFAMTTCPTGWLKTNGASISSTTYANLFSAIGYMYGGTGGNFNLPDYRGQFLRAWAEGSSNDPDRASRTNRGDGTTGDVVGTKQGGEIQSHSHSIPYFDDRQSGLSGGNWHTTLINWSGGNSATTGGSETRPTNINVLYCIKY